MSKTFTSRPATLARGRGRGSGTRLGEPQSQEGRRQQSELDSNHSFNRAPTQGRGRSRGRGARMDYQGYPSGRRPGQYGGARQTPGQYGAGGAQGDDDPTQPGISPERETGGDQRGRYAGGYTVFNPNERKRQQVNEMAQREMQQYEQYKQANAPKHFSYVGTVGGGEMSQDQARSLQANSVRAQKFNRLQRQEAQRQAKKNAEEQEIEQKRVEARRKAEQNEARLAQRQAPAEEVRRKREAFLRQFESKSSEKEPPPNQPSMSSVPSNVSSAQGKSQTLASKSASRPTVPKPSQSSSSSMRAPLSTSTADSVDGHGVEAYADDLSILTSMFPDLDPSYLSDLLTQLGSIDEVLKLLDIGD